MNSICIDMPKDIDEGLKLKVKSFRLMNRVIGAIAKRAEREGISQNLLVERLLGAALYQSGDLSELPERVEQRGGTRILFPVITPEMSIAEVVETRSTDDFEKLSKDSGLTVKRLQTIASKGDASVPEIIAIGQAIGLDPDHVARLCDKC